MAEPSKVIHVRNVGQEITEADLLQLVRPFGTVTKLVMIRSKNQALLQLDELESAVSALEYYTTVQPHVRGRNIYLQFSSHQELTTTGDGEGNSHMRQSDQELPPNRILLVTIHHMTYPITVDILHQVFSPYGFVEKIVTFQKTAGFQALIQFEQQQDAIEANDALHGRNIYDGCCQIEIQYSNLQELQVHYNGERSRDFTNPELPVDNRSSSSQSGYGDGGGIYAYRSHDTRGAYHQTGGGYGGAPNGRCTLLVTNLDPNRMDEDKLFNLFSMYGNVVRIKLLRNKPDHALVQMSDNFQAELGMNCLRGTKLYGKKMEITFSKYSEITPSPDARDYANSSLSRFHSGSGKNYRHCTAPTKTIHISSLPREVTEDDIIAHLGEHGVIVNTRIFEVHGKTQALVSFENEEAATEALVCKHASAIDGALIRISFSQTHNQER
ncbi:Polypyrimidine tract-binding protein-like protein [Rhynchospora pubera]|uniref:Polypyrimidine tract-binding protein-like protein n=1 Tax=Rhynchospora pubera TaxID=906938 RepID=A0AAV8BX21_9POAL|nr:Polypyrimidine tract-binding protein-like protein [Rhynchospora pubera]